MGATLRAPESYINRLSAACAWGVLDRRGELETVVRPGSGGPRRRDGIIIYRSSTLAGATTTLNGVPITSMARTLLDLASFTGDRALARALREAIRLERTTLREVGDQLGRFEGRRGSARLAQAISRYCDLPLERARSGAEIRALEVLRDAGRPMPQLNLRIAGEEADLCWQRERLIIEVDGRPFHQDRGADARKEKAWRDAGWRVERLPSNAVYEQPHMLIALAPQAPIA